MDDAGHFPVLVQNVVVLLAPAAKGCIIDCTVGLGGHALALLEACPQSSLVGIDLDQSNLLKTKERLSRFGGRVRLFEANFSDLSLVCREAGLEQVDVILADLGVSSTQLDQADRGFSFQQDGALDMRMRRQGPSAADLINGMAEDDLADCIFRYGEERFSRRIARAIVEQRRIQRIDRTMQLAEIVARAVPHGRPGRKSIHPATRTFQALRIAVNGELDNLERLLEEIPRRLAVGGRAGIISFHSLEDRLVKQAFVRMAATETHRIVTRKPVVPDENEMERNPRSRSAKLRVVERIR